MAFEEYQNIASRIALKEADADMMDMYAWRNRWSMIGIFTSEDNPDIITESVYKPANKDILIEFIIDKITLDPYVLIRIANDSADENLIFAKEIADAIMQKIPHFSLMSIIEKAEDFASFSKNEIHALGKGYNPQLRSEIVLLLNQIAQSTDSTVKQKKAAIIAIGYISDPLHFNPILELLTQDLDSEVAKLAQSMLEAGQAVIKQE